MKIKSISGIIALGLFVIITLVIISNSLNTTVHSRSGQPFAIKFTLIIQSVGALITILSAALLFVRAALGQPLANMIPLTVPLLAGALVASAHWGTAIAIGAIAVTFIIREKPIPTAKLTTTQADE